VSFGTDMTMSDYKRLEVWQKSRVLAREIYAASGPFPRHELFGLTHQIRSAAVSIASNIAEGAGRGSRRDRRKFMLVARGSAFEVETQLIIAEDLGYLSAAKSRALRESTGEIARMLAGLIRYYTSNDQSPVTND
jgi:four helix bundle protein